ncbi:MAG: glutathione S-transferase family protein [Deltaproteobacteria bacterium]|nr:MAG: glutathione S-transferase family protein [Deltaproteobacteria bacterium]
MIKLYHAPRTRSVRILWLLEELGLPYAVERVEFRPPEKHFFAQATPLGKLPTLEDGDVVMCESGAIVEYILERYGEGRLAPPPGSRERAAFLQWLHFAESTAFPPLGIVVWLTRYRSGSEPDAELLEDARSRARTGLDVLERALDGHDYLVGADFTAADIMMGFTLVAARVLGVLDERYPHLDAYLERLQSRPAFQKAIAVA